VVPGKPLIDTFRNQRELLNNILKNY